jgi:hypothetical protein
VIPVAEKRTSIPTELESQDPIQSAEPQPPVEEITIINSDDDLDDGLDNVD